jgi:hypothetical protein
MDPEGVSYAELKFAPGTGLAEVNFFTEEMLKTHNEKIARAAFEAGYDVAHVWPTQMKRNIKDSAWDSFLQSDEYKALIGEKV